MSLFNNDWDEVLKEEINAPYFKSMGYFLSQERLAGKTIYPNKEDYFKALKLTSYKDTRVVILGQDPYVSGEADGLAFSVSDVNITKMPASLKNILDAVEEDVYGGFRIEEEWSLERWAKQGVLLLNKYLSVEKGKPSSHSHIGWVQFTNSIISLLSAKEETVCFILLGKEAQKVEPLIIKHPVLVAEHPAAAAYNNRKWEHNKVFSTCNKILTNDYKETEKKIEW